MNLNKFKFSLSHEEILWLKEIYNSKINNEDLTVREIRVNLYDKIPLDFKPSEIDNRLISNEKELSLLGIMQVDPDSDLPEKCDKLLKFIKNKILNNPKISTIEIGYIADKLNLKESEISNIFYLIRNYGYFYNANSKERFAIGDDKVFEHYLKYENIENLLNDFYEKNDPKKPVKVVYGKTGPIGKFRIIDDDPKIHHPIFRTKIDKIDKKLCFVLMPFSEKWSDSVYKNLIRESVEKLGFQCLRADNLTGQIIIEDIWTKINQCAFIIAEVTTRNPNVMYELGIVHALGKPAILITQNINDIPFDFTHLRHYEYKDTIAGTDDFKSKLPQIIKDIYKEFYLESAIMINK